MAPILTRVLRDSNVLHRPAPYWIELPQFADESGMLVTAVFVRWPDSNADPHQFW